MKVKTLKNTIYRSILMKVPFEIFVARFIYILIAKNRSKLSNEGCEI